MNISTSECSSGCESGWTMYLDQLSNSSTDPYSKGLYTNYGGKGTHVKDEDEDDEDLSMVSDASSGPPHYYAYTSSVSQDTNKFKHQRKTKTKEPKKKQSVCLDDTASSPFYSYSQNNVPPSYNHNSVEVYSDTQGESMSKKHLSFFKSSTKGKSGSLLGRKRQ